MSDISGNILCYFSCVSNSGLFRHMYIESFRILFKKLMYQHRKYHIIWKFGFESSKHLILSTAKVLSNTPNYSRIINPPPHSMKMPSEYQRSFESDMICYLRSISLRISVLAACQYIFRTDGYADATFLAPS